MRPLFSCTMSVGVCCLGGPGWVIAVSFSFNEESFKDPCSARGETSFLLWEASVESFVLVYLLSQRL